MDPSQHHNALNRHDRLHWYEIESILGQGGFGITYLARDTNLDQKVAIKEYLPSEFSTRDKQNTVQPISENHTEIFDWGKQRFLDEARTLAQFRHPNVVRVSSFFENNNTGYMVMEYEEGTDLAAMIKAGESFDERRLLDIILPVLDGLALVHEQGFIHRDIKPANIFIRHDGSPVLIDFGSARQAIGGQTKTLTSLVTPGFAPFEQYHDTEGKQGPWTDIYSLGATCYAMLTGKAPIDALKRGMARLEHSTDAYLHLVDLVGDRYSEHLLRAIDHALEFKEAERPQDVVEWQSMLLGERAVPQSEIATQLAASTAVAEPDGDTRIVTRPEESTSTHTAPTRVVTAPASETVETTRPDTAPPPAAETGAPARTPDSDRRRQGLVAAVVVLVVIVAAIAGYLVLPSGDSRPPAVIESRDVPDPNVTVEAVAEVPPVQPSESVPAGDDAQVEAEQQALRVEQARIAEQKARLAEEKAQLEAEKIRQAEIARQQALAKQQAEKKRQQALAKQQAEEKRQQALAKQQAEEKRQQALAKQQAEKKRQQALAKQQAEKKRQQQIAQQQGSAAAATADFNGLYVPDEGFEELKLTQTGNRVKGVIGNEGSSLEGTVRGNRLEFTFRYSRTGYGFKEGTGELTLSADGSRLTGSRYKGGFAQRTPWSLSRKRAQKLAANLVDFSGVYLPDDGFEELELTQSGTRVKGVIGNEGSSLEGTVQGNRLEFTFRYSRTGYGFKEGTGELTLSADGSRLTGSRYKGGFVKRTPWALTRKTEPSRATSLFEDLSGVYRPDQGFEDLELTQKGNKVKGIIGTNGSTLEGTRKGNRITFVFNYSKTGFGFKDGYGQFTISADGKRLTGSRSRGGFAGNSPWNLTRQTDH